MTHLLTTGELAEQLGVSRGAILNWANGSRFRLTPAVTTKGGHHRWDLDDVRRQLAAHRKAVDSRARPGPAVSVVGLVVDGGRVLVVQREDGRWEPPAGALAHDEPLDIGVRRVVADEAGVAVEVQQLTGVYQDISQCTVQLAFRCRPCGAATGEPRWAEPGEAAELMDPVTATLATDAFIDSQPVVRAPDGIQLVPS